MLTRIWPRTRRAWGLFTERITALLQSASGQAARSSVLGPVLWLFGLCVAGVMLSVKYGAPGWVIIFFAVLAALAIATILFAFVFCLFKDRDSLRSEKYSIQKLAIEKSFKGDTLTGVFGIELPISKTPLLPDPTAKGEQA